MNMSGIKTHYRRVTGSNLGRLVLLLLVVLVSAALVGCDDDTAGEAPQDPFPDPDIINWVFDIWGTGTDNVFAVGRPGFILHFDGAAWTRTDVSAGTLTSVWGTGPNDVYACGHEGVLFHYDGSSWSSLDSGTEENLYDVGLGPYGEIYIVGQDGTLKRRSGSSWVSTQRRAYRDYPLEGDPPVEQAPNDTLVFNDSVETLTAVSVYGIAGNSAIMLMENDHVGFDHEWLWGVVEDNDFSLLTTIFSHATVEDNFVATDDGKILRLATSLDGLQWKQPADQLGNAIYPATHPSRLTDLWLDEAADVLYMTTWTGQIATMTQDTYVSQIVYNGTGYLSAIWGTGSDNIYASGHGGAMLHFDGGDWETVDLPLPDNTTKTMTLTDKFGRPLL